jgi:hypothetical protein
MSDAKTLEELAFAKYWDERYGKPDAEESFEWFKSYENLKGFLGKWLPKVEEGGEDGKEGEGKADQPLILHLGCGNSVSAVSSLCVLLLGTSTARMCCGMSMFLVYLLLFQHLTISGCGTKIGTSNRNIGSDVVVYSTWRLHRI